MRVFLAPSALSFSWASYTPLICFDLLGYISCFLNTFLSGDIVEGFGVGAYGVRALGLKFKFKPSHTSEEELVVGISQRNPDRSSNEEIPGPSQDENNKYEVLIDA